MRAMVIVCAALVAACDNGVVIEVSPAPGLDTTKVQLYIGLARCDDCPGIKPPSPDVASSGEVLPGAVYYREDSGRTTILREATVDGGVARFRIEASEIRDRFELAVATDIDNRSAVLIPSLPLDEARVYKVELVAASPALGPKPAATSGNFVSVWKQPSGATPCMGFERWADGRLVGDRVFIVPETDLDCDEVVAECNEYAHNSIGVPAIADTTCTTHATLFNETICKLGGPACHDTSGNVEACSPSEYCLPSAYCDRINNPNCTTFDEPLSLLQCLFKTPPVARLRCSVPVKASASGYSPCGSVAVKIPQMAPLATGVTCLGPGGPLMLGQPMAVTAGLAFTENVRFSATDPAGTATLDVGIHHQSSCEYKLELSGTLGENTVVGGKLPFAPFFQLALQRNGGAIRKLLLPLVVETVVDDTCTREGTCVLEVSELDDLVQCLR